MIDVGSETHRNRKGEKTVSKTDRDKDKVREIQRNEKDTEKREKKITK
jgi:hypothetical protein